MNRHLKYFLNLILIACIGISLSGCMSSRLPFANSSPWQEVSLSIEDNPLDIAFVDKENGFLVGSNRLILETKDGGSSWEKRDLDIPSEQNFRLISIDFKDQEGWLAGQPGLVMHTNDAGKSWTRLSLGNNLPGDPFLITTLGKDSAELATTAGAVYTTTDAGENWVGRVADSSGGVRDLRRSEEGNYVSVSSLGNYFVTLELDQDAWQPHQRASSKRVQTLGYQPNGQLWMLSRGAEMRLNDEDGNIESWGKPIIPIVNGYNYLDMGWDPDGGIWAGGGNGTLLVSNDNAQSWEKDPIADLIPTNLIKILFIENIQSEQGIGFVLGERGHLLKWVGYPS